MFLHTIIVIIGNAARADEICVPTGRYEAGQQFTSTFVLGLLRSMVAALDYLHQTMQIAHGDVYGHNTLVNADATAVRGFLARPQ